METALSFLTVLPSTKKQINSFANQIIDSVIEGNEDALKIKIQCKFVEETLKKIQEGISEYAENEAHKFPEKTILLDNCDITKTERADYDFISCNDSILIELEQELKLVKEKIEKRKALLKTIPESGLIDQETGEIILPAVKTTNSYLTIKIK